MITKITVETDGAWHGVVLYNSEAIVPYDVFVYYGFGPKDEYNNQHDTVREALEDLMEELTP